MHLFAIMRSQQSECGHGINRQRLRYRSGKGLGKERYPPFGFTTRREELSPEPLIGLRDEEGWCSETARRLLLRLSVDLVVQQLLDMVNGQQMLAVH
jgi:hypothetical protein